MSVISEYRKTQSERASGCCQICVITGDEMSAYGWPRNPQYHHHSRKI